MPFKKVVLTEKQKDTIIRMYRDGSSVHACGKAIGRSGDFIHSRLKEWGIELREAAHARKYNLNHHAFSSFTEESLYFAGLIMSDGHVYTSSRATTQTTIGLCSKDKDVLRKFLSFVDSPNRPLYDNRDGTFSVSFTSDAIARDLRSRFGITERKSKTAKIPDIVVAYSRHFWRGMIDGDGHVGGSKRKCVYFCSASDHTAESYMNLLRDLGIAVKNYKRKSGFNNIYTGGDDAIKLVKFLYDGASVYMNRKNDAANEMIKKGGDANE